MSLVLFCKSFIILGMANKYKNALKHTLLTAVLAISCLVGSAVPALAADYNCGAYGVSTYGNNVCTAQQSSGGSLSNTGQALKFVVPAALILAGTLLLFRTRKKMKSRQPDPPLPTDHSH